MPDCRRHSSGGEWTRVAKKVTLHLEGDAISAQVFYQKVGAFLDMLRALDRNVTEDLAPESDAQISVTWVVENVRKGSLDLDLLGEPATDDAEPLVADRVIASIESGLERLMAAAPMRELPPYFTFPVLEAIRDLVRPSTDGVLAAAIITPHKRIVLTDKARPNLNRFLRPVFSHFGAVEGILEMVSVAGGPHFSIRDRLSGRSIRCTVQRGRVRAVAGFLEQRVSVTGRVRTNELGDVLSVAMEEIEAFPPDAELPGIRDVAGKFDITRGKSMQEHRDALWGLPDAS